jgi:hypothetical protein
MLNDNCVMKNANCCLIIADIKLFGKEHMVKKITSGPW